MNISFCKKAIAVLLSAIMVISMIPSFAITAFAASGDNLKLKLFTTDNVLYDDVSNNSAALENAVEGGAMTYDSVTGMANFDPAGSASGQYAHIKTSLNATSGINANTGATISFAFRKDFNEWHRHLLSFGSDEYGGSGNASSNSFYISGTTCWMAAEHHGYTANSLFIGYVDGSGNQLLNVFPDYAFEVGTVYDVTITITKTAIVYYINGEKVNTINDGDTYTEANLTAALNALGTFNQNYIGIGRWGDGTFKGALKNLCLYNTALTESEVLSPASTYQAAMADFDFALERIDAGLTANEAYHGLDSVYDAYVSLSREYSENSTSSQIPSKASALIDATGSLSVYSAVTGSAMVDWEASGTGNINSSNNANILYASPTVTTNGYQVSLAASDGANVKSVIYYPTELAIQYDGKTTPLIPVSLGASKNTSKSRYVYGAYPSVSSTDASDSNDFALAGYWWAGNDWSDDLHWSYHWDYTTTYKFGYNYATGNKSGSSVGTYKTGNLYNQDKPNHYFNILKFIANPTDTLTDYRPTWYRCSGNDISDEYYLNNRGDDYNHIYVLNLAKVRKAVSAYQKMIFDLGVKNYPEGGLSSYFSAPALESAMSLTNLNGYFSGDAAFSTKLTNAKKAIDNAVKGVTALVKEGVAEDTLIYRESFNGASIDGKAFTTGETNTKGINGTLSHSSDMEVLPAHNANLDGNGNSNDYRKNVLKINSSSSNEDVRIMTFDSNPLASSAEIKKNATLNGVTISFWRAFGSEVNHPWQPSISFVDENNNKWYFTICGSGPSSFSAGAVNAVGNYFDFIQLENDNTTHAVGDYNTCWVNYTITINPLKGVTIYTNGEPHDVGITSISYNDKGARVLTNNRGAIQHSYYNNDAEVAKDIISFLTNSDTKFELADGNGYNHNSIDQYIDDIRIYTEVKTQVEINNMFNDDYADSQPGYDSSMSHDPTNVAVYTLARNIETFNNGTKTAGSKVGQDFIDYYHLDITDTDDISSIEYYSFGTGMTIYHSLDNINWTVVGDSEGRCGYQNEELFGDVYTVALHDELEWCTKATRYENATGAGYLQWAPHVCYNLAMDKWCYYGSTSDWNSAKSAIFMSSSDSITGPYENPITVFKSGDGYWDVNAATPGNAIDSCVYYGRDNNGDIIKEDLYLIYGSWGPGYVIKLNPENGHYEAMESVGADLENVTAYNNTHDPDYCGTMVYEGMHDTYELNQGGYCGEGSYIVYENGYYYFYITMGANNGNYEQRVFRSTQPDGGFVTINNSSATYATDIGAPHGSPILTSFFLPVNDYVYTSIGHNSLYKAVNNNNEIVSINAAHTRPFSTNSNSSKEIKAMEDAALATRQSELGGSVSIHNMVAYTEHKWPVAMPLLYNGDDTTNMKASALDFEGTYTGNVLMMIASYNYARPKEFIIDATSATTGTIRYDSFDYDFVVTYGTDYAGNDITYLTIKDASGNAIAEGVIAKQGDTFEFSFLDIDTSNHTWGYKVSDDVPERSNPTDVETSAETFDGVSYHQGTPATNAYSNVVFSTTGTTWSGTSAHNNSSITVGAQNLKIAMPSYLVLAYDGVNDTYGPVLFEQVRTSDTNTTFNYIAPNSSDYTFKNNWYGYNDSSSNGEAYKLWPGDTYNSSNATAQIGYSSSNTYNYSARNDSSRFFWNKLYFSGTFAEGEYFKRADNQTFAVRVNSNTNATIYSNNTQYVINYKPVYDIINGNVTVDGTDLTLAAAFADIQAHPTKYTVSSVSSVYEAVRRLNNAKVKSYNYWDSVDVAVISSTRAIEYAVTTFNKVTLDERADFSKIDAAYAQADSILEGLKGNAQAMYTATSVENLITAFSAATSTVSLTDAEKAETVKSVAQSGIDTKKTNILNAIAALETSNPIAADIDAYQAVIKTTKSIDPDAYDCSQDAVDSRVEFIAEDSAEIVGTVSYDNSTIKVVKESAEQSSVDYAVRNVASYLTQNLKKYYVKVEGNNSASIDVSYKGNGWNGEFDRTEDEVVKHYKGATLNAIAVFRSSDPNTAWYMEYESSTASRGKQYQGYGETFETKVLGDITVWAVNADADSEKQNKLSIVRDYHNDSGKYPVQLIDYVGSTYTLPEAPVILGYDFTGYEIVEGYGEGVTREGNELSGISGEIQIKANYQKYLSDGYTVHVWGTDDNDLADPDGLGNLYNYNDNINVTDNSAYGWVEKIQGTDNYRPFFIGKNLNFFVSEATEIKAVETAEDFAAYGFVLPAINCNQSPARTVIGTKNKTYFNGQIVVDPESELQVVEYGFLIGIERASAINDDDLVVEKVVSNDDYRIMRAKSTKLVGANQFTIAVNGLSGHIVYRGYIKYSAKDSDDNTVIYTTYTDVLSVDI